MRHDGTVVDVMDALEVIASSKYGGVRRELADIAEVAPSGCTGQPSESCDYCVCECFTFDLPDALPDAHGFEED